MQIEQALMTFLLSQTSITDLVSQRIYFVKAPQKTETPYMIITKVSGLREHSHGGASELAGPKFQFSVFDGTYSGVKNILAALQAALQGYTGSMGGSGGVCVHAAFYDNEKDLYEEETGLHHGVADYIIWHEE